MLEGVLTTISRYNMLTPGARVIAAVSGGADSVCLAHVLGDLGPALGIELAGIAHFNHQLRGADSQQDECFVAELARALGVPLYRAEGGAAPVHGNLEQHLRRARRDFFSALLAQGKADRIALGHTLDDQAETVLFRMLRGSGLAGLAGILPVTAEGFVRPLLGSRRAEVEQFLRARGIAWREDVSNLHPRFARNRIRHGLLPQLEREWNPRLREALAHAADLAYEEERSWAQRTAALSRTVLHATRYGIEIQTRELSSLPPAQARRLVREAIRRSKGNLQGVEYRHVEAVLHMAAPGMERGSGRMDLPGLRVVRSFDWILLQAEVGQVAAPETAVPGPGSYPAPDGNSVIRLEVARRGAAIRTPAPTAARTLVQTAAFGSGACATLKLDGFGSKAHELQLRGWRAGDHYCPHGQSRDRKLKEMFQQARVPSWRRPLWPILSAGARIVWARGFGVAEEFAVRDGNGPRVRFTEES